MMLTFQLTTYATCFSNLFVYLTTQVIGIRKATWNGQMKGALQEKAVKRQQENQYLA